MHAAQPPAEPSCNARHHCFLSSRDNLCTVDKLAVLSVVFNNCTILFILYQERAWSAFWHYLALFLVILATHALSLHHLRTSREAYYRHKRQHFIIAHRLIRAGALIVGSWFIDPDTAAQPWIGLGMHHPSDQTPPTYIWNFVRQLILRTCVFFGVMYVFIFPASFYLQLALHLTCLPGFLMCGLATARVLQRPEYLGHTCGLYNAIEWMLPGPPYTHPEGARISCSPHAALVLTSTVRSWLLL